MNRMPAANPSAEQFISLHWTGLQTAFSRQWRVGGQQCLNVFRVVRVLLSLFDHKRGTVRHGMFLFD